MSFFVLLLDLGIQHLNAFNRAMNFLDEKFKFLSSAKQIVSVADEEDKVRLSVVNHFGAAWMLLAVSFILVINKFK